MFALTDIVVRRVVWDHSERINGGSYPRRSPESNLSPRELARLAIERTTESRIQEIFGELKEGEKTSAPIC